MTPRLKKHLWLAARILVSVVCVTWVLCRVNLVDHLTLTDGQSVHGWITQQSAAAVTIREGASGEVHTYALGELARDPGSGAPVVAQGFLHVFAKVFRHGGWPWFVAAILACALAMVPAAWRWQRLLRVQDIRLTFGEAWLLSYIGSFFNTFMLGMTGGDVVRAYYVSRHTERKAEAVTTVFFDRLVGIFGFGLLGGAALLCRWNDPALREVQAVIGAFLAACCVGSLVFYSRRLRRLLLIEKLLDHLPFHELIRRLDSAVFIYRYHGRTLLLAMLQTWLCQLLNVACVYLCARALNLNPIPLYFLIYMPVIWILAAFFPSVGALGVIEGLTQHYFGAGVLGVATNMEALNTALALALLYRASMFLAVLPGGILNIIHPKVSLKESKQQAEADNLAGD